MRTVLGLTWLLVAVGTVSAGELGITELLASSTEGGLPDEDGDTPDWFEVTNTGSVVVDLADFAATDDPSEPDKWIFPTRSLGPGDSIVVFASGKDRRKNSGNLHANFKLNAAGEYLGLFSAEQPRRPVSEYQPTYPEQRPNISYGIGRGGERVYFLNPTPATDNGFGEAVGGIVRTPVPNVPRGFYTIGFAVDLVPGTAGAETLYTLDGSVPTRTNGAKYTGPISIEPTANRAVFTLRTAAFKDGFLPSRTGTWTYVFPERVLDQPADPEGFPEKWGSHTTRAADYEMDPEVLATPEARDLAAQALLSVPTLSIVTDHAHLWDPASGIYMNGERLGVDWERPTSAELLFPDGRDGVQIDAGLRIQGGTSTTPWNSAKLSMRLLFKGDYGFRKLEFPVFSDSEVERFDMLVLDAHHYLTYTHPTVGTQSSSQYCRDEFVSDLQRATGRLSPHSVFVNLYLNGLYWGLYSVHERPDTSFQAAYLGGSKNEFDSLRHNAANVVDGDTGKWNQMMAIVHAGLADNDAYVDLQEHFDVPAFIDYMIVNIFVGNTDWPHQNWYAGARRNGGRYRFFSWDAEQVLKSVAEDRASVDRGTPGDLYQRLQANAEYRQLFADHVQRHFVNPGGALYVDPVRPRWDPSAPERNVPASLYMRRSSEIDVAMVLESARWGDNRRELPHKRGEQWLRERDRLVGSYFRERSRIVVGQLESVGLSSTIVSPVLSQHGGNVPGGFELEMTNPTDNADVIFFTLNGPDPHDFGTGAVASAASEYGGSISIDGPTVVKARILVDSTWSAVTEAVFSVPSHYDALHLTEVMYNPIGGRAFEFIELRNFGTAVVDLSHAAFVDGIEFEFPAGSDVAPGEFVVLASNGERFSERYPTVSIAGVYRGALSNSGERVTLVDIIGNVILSFRYDDGNGWPVAADGFGSSLVLDLPGSDLNDPRSWKASMGSRGFPSTVARSQDSLGIAINEILARSTPPYEDAIEIYNGSDIAVDIGGWFLSDDRDSADALRKFRIPEDTVVQPGGYVVFYETDFRGGVRAFALDGSGEGVYLSSANSFGTLSGFITSFEFDGSDENVTNGMVPTSLGDDVARLGRPSFGAGVPTNVDEFRLGRGAANADPTVGPLVISEFHYDPHAGEIEYVELQNLTEAPIELYDVALSRGWQLGGLSNPGDGRRFEFPKGSVMPAAGFVLLVSTSADLFRLRADVPPDVDLYQFSGSLENTGERLRLTRPTRDAGGELGFVTIDAVSYGDGPPWPGRGGSERTLLVRRDAHGYGNEPLNWGVSRDGSPGGPNDASCVVERRVSPQEIGNGGDAEGIVEVTLRGEGLYGTVDVTEIVPSGWRFVSDGGGVVDGRRLTLALASESEIRYCVWPNADSPCADSLITGTFGGDCHGVVSGYEIVACRSGGISPLMRVDIGSAGACQAEADSEWTCMTGCGTQGNVQGSGIDVTIEAADSFGCHGRQTTAPSVPNELRAVADDLLFAGGVCGPPNGGFTITFENLMPGVRYVFQSFHFWDEGSPIVMPGVEVSGATIVEAPTEIVSGQHTFSEPATVKFVADSSTVALRLFAPPCTAPPPQQAVLNGFVFGTADVSGGCEPGEDGESSCDDGIDNDCDNDVDGADIDCAVARVGPFLRGDCDGDGSINGSPGEAILLLIWAFRGGTPPPCLAACDAEANGAIGATDAVRILRFVFSNGMPPDGPFPECVRSERRTDVESGCELATCGGGE